MPGVFVLTWDNCEFGEQYRHGQVLVTNMPWLAPLGRDCKGGHTHLRIGFTGDVRTDDVSPYSWGWCKEYAQLLSTFCREPVESRCVHCLPQGKSDMNYNRRESMRRCAEHIGLGDSVDQFTVDVNNFKGEVYLSVQPSTKAALVKTQLGARCVEPVARMDTPDFFSKFSKP